MSLSYWRLNYFCFQNLNKSDQEQVHNGDLALGMDSDKSQGHICYQDGGWMVSVTMLAVCMGVKEVGMRTGHRGTYNQLPSQE